LLCVATPWEGVNKIEVRSFLEVLNQEQEVTDKSNRGNSFSKFKKKV